jgi:Flp pilus assembly pilin Flp
MLSSSFVSNRVQCSSHEVATNYDTAMSFKRKEAVHHQGDSGAALVEYGLLLFFIALTVIVVLSVFGVSLRELFTTSADRFAEAS